MADACDRRLESRRRHHAGSDSTHAVPAEGTEFRAGQRYLYSNSGFTLLAEIVRRVSGKPLPDFCEERIFGPLGMTRTHFHLDLHRVVPGPAYSYSSAKGAGFERPSELRECGATSLFTTPGDLVKWLDNFRDPKVGGPAAIARMQEQCVLTDGK